MMGAGKSTVGPMLARDLSRRFVDLDEEIEREAGRSIREIFAREGEASFRALERRALERWAGRDAVVALGGGAIAQEGSPEFLAATGTVVYLRADPEVLLARLGDGDERPLLRDLEPTARRARIEALLEERRGAYESARIVIEAGGDDPEALAAALALRLAGEGPA